MRVCGLAKIITGFTEEDIVVEESRKRKPTDIDLKSTIKFLKDFGIHMKIEQIPDFATMSELLRWRLEIVKKKLK